MAGYLVRRLFQMMVVVLLSTMAIYLILNVAPGGPLSGLRLSTNPDDQVSDTDMNRLRAFLGIDKPLMLRYVAWLVGEDWLGADKLCLEPGGCRLTRVDADEQAITDRQGKVKQDTYRFWAAPGMAYLKPGYKLWVLGTQRPDGSVEATWIKSRPEAQDERPAGALQGRLYQAQGGSFILERGEGQHTQVHINGDTQFLIPDRPETPSDGGWVSVGWLFGNQGLLGRYAPYHGDGRGVARLDWGTSWKIASGQPVIGLIKSRLAPTLMLMSLATVLSLVVAIPIGIYSAVKQYSKLDYAVTTFSFFGSAMPVFWFGLMMVLLFSIMFREWGLPFFPSGGLTSPRTPPDGSLLAALNANPGGLVDRVFHLVLPGITLSLLYMARWSRFMRASMLEVLRQDYVRTARAKGLRERMVVAKHALRNGLIPIITIVVFQLPNIFGGAIITETIFAYPGMGRLYFQALGASDWPVVMVNLLITAVLVVVATLIGDVLYTVVDPRIRYD